MDAEDRSVIRPRSTSRIERGLCEPSVEMAVTLCEAYGGRRKELEGVMLELYSKQLRDRIARAPKGRPLR